MAEFAMIQTHITLLYGLLYVSGISLFLQFFNSTWGTYSFLLGKVGEGE